MLGPQILGAWLMSGDKPIVPKFKAIDTQEEQAAAIKGNLMNFADASKLAGQTNVFNQEQINKMLEMNMPGYGAMQKQAGQNIGAELRGELPKDVEQAITRNDAVRSLYGGYSEGSMSRNLVARDLGLTSLQLTQHGLDSATKWMQSARIAPLMDVSSMFITPQQRIQTTMWNKEMQFNRDWMANKIDAMPDPTMAAIGGAIIKTDDQITSMASSVAGAAAGAAM